jgi:glutathione synthase/RimK-type ligase-like ATP-grasp enzyme
MRQIGQGRATSARVLVTGAGTGATNNLVRSLRTSDPGLVVVGCHDDPFLLKKSTADRNFLVSRRSDARFIESLGRVIELAEADLVIPTTDPDVRAIGELRDQLRCRTFLPQKPAIELCQDKYELTTFLRSRGIPAPRTCAVTDLDSIGGLVARLGRGGRLWCRIRTGAGSRGATPVTSVAEARAWVSYWEAMRAVPPSAFTLSEYLPGRDFACQSLWKDGRLVLIKTTERIAYFGGAGTPSGVSSIGAVHKTVREPRVAEVSAAAVRALDDHASGAFSVDLKEDGAGVPCVTEINVGRLLSGTTIFDLTGRHNMAATYVRLALDEPVAIDDPYDVVPDHYMVRDLDTLPDVFHGDTLFDGIEDARVAHPERRPDGQLT